MDGTNYRLERIEGKVDKVLEEITHIKVTQAKQHVTLDEHIRRTAILEKALVPIQKFTDRQKFLLKLAGVIGTLIIVFCSLWPYIHR
jgi:hypothetical protein